MLDADERIDADCVTDAETDKLDVELEDNDGLLVLDADERIDLDCVTDAETDRLDVELEDSLGLAEDDKTDASDGVAVWHGELDNDMDGDVVNDAKGD